MMIETMENRRTEYMEVEHLIELPSMCPVSGNPQSGSTLKIKYVAKDKTIEVYSLKKCVTSFVGGHANGIRNMEGVIQQIGEWVADALGVTVRLKAKLNLDTGKMEVKTRISPSSIGG